MMNASIHDLSVQSAWMSPISDADESSSGLDLDIAEPRKLAICILLVATLVLVFLPAVVALLAVFDQPALDRPFRWLERGAVLIPYIGLGRAAFALAVAGLVLIGRKIR